MISMVVECCAKAVPNQLSRWILGESLDTIIFDTTRSMLQVVRQARLEADFWHI